jgi:hypothetical protein
MENYLKTKKREFRQMVFSGAMEPTISHRIAGDLGVSLDGQEVEFLHRYIDETKGDEKIVKECTCGNCIEPEGGENLDAIRQGTKKSSKLRVGIERGMKVRFEGTEHTVINFDPVDGLAVLGTTSSPIYGSGMWPVPARLCELYFLANADPTS